ncbi:hypothetical protein BLJ79_18075 [Arthrobacter sp. UCD-GKA]|nr:hypothetical protein BLJ79_18075 [Arthrobacter sp. UCD-GKA]RAX47313.1 hypothetical protein DQ353_19245 [Arthrobacter sp. AQ5-05]
MMVLFSKRPIVVVDSLEILGLSHFFTVRVAVDEVTLLRFPVTTTRYFVFDWDDFAAGAV